jgi:ABC-type amino acid transport substrate-binding protein
MKMKKIVCVFLAWTMLFVTAAAASADHLADIRERGKLIVGAEVGFAPFEFYFTDENGEEYAAGFEMDFARELAKTIGVELEISDLAFTGLIPTLQAGDVDMLISAVSATPERREAVDFSDTYYMGELSIVVRAEDLDKYKAAEDVKGVMLGAQMGSIQQTALEEQFMDSEHLLLPKVPTLLMELVNGNVEGVMCTRIVAESYMSLDEYAGLAFSEIPVEYASSGVGVALRKDPENETLMQLVNETIARVTADGTFDAWYAKACEQNAQLLKAEMEAEAE